MNFLKKHSIVAAIVVAIVVVIALGAWYMMGRGSSSSTDNSGGLSTQNVKQIAPEAIGLSISVNKDGKSLDLSANKLTGIKTLEYEMTYNAEETDPDSGQTSDVSKGVLSSSPLEVNGQSSIKRNILLGTCSANVCRYDKVKSDIQVTVKVTYTNGSVASVTLKVPYSGNPPASTNTGEGQ